MAGTRRPKEKTPPQTNRIGFAVVVLIALLLSRLLVVTEGPEMGHTLWLAVVTFGWATFAAGFAWRWELRIPLRLSLLDLGVGVLVLGHLLSGASILLGSGNQRAALNMMWEWGAIGLFWILLQQAMNEKSARQFLVVSLVATSTALAGLGIWQHYFWYPQQSQRMDLLISYIERVEQKDALAADEQREYRGLLEEYGASVATLDAAGRMALRSRYHDSVEPIGRFALANSFASVLSISLLFLLPVFVNQFSAISIQSKVTSVLVAGLILLCLILTKSRTAWVGTLCGLMLFALLHWKHRQGQAGLPKWILTTSAIGTLALIFWATWTGGLDPQVISEAPKSLQYRLEYWTATLQMLQDHPTLGAGPGNFRQYYLSYKLPGSSEEILDPHNLFLGAWAAGGILGLLGLLTLLFAATAYVFNSSSKEQAERIFLKPMLLTQFIAVLFVATAQFLLQGGPDSTLLMVSIGGIATATMICTALPNFTLTLTAIAAAFVGLTVHLLGASGIEMPAIAMLLLVLVTLLKFESNSPQWTHSLTLTGRPLLATCGVCAGLMLLCTWSGLVPVQLAKSEIETGQHLLLAEGKPRLAREFFMRAAQADGLSPEPQQQLAQLYFRFWQESGKQDELQFDKAVEALNAAIDLDPRAAVRHRLLGNLWDQRFLASQDPQHAQKAASAYANAVERYPHFAALQRELAVAQFHAGMDAGAAAQNALELDQHNRDLMHTDKLLTDEQRDQLKEILKSSE